MFVSTSQCKGRAHDKGDVRVINISDYIPGLYYLKSSDGRYGKFIKQ